MKIPVTKLDESSVLKTHPIADLVPGWFFRCEEQSNNVWRADGTDLWGRRVGFTDSDYDGVLQQCVEQAKAINSQLTGANK